MHVALRLQGVEGGGSGGGGIYLSTLIRLCTQAVYEYS